MNADRRIEEIENIIYAGEGTPELIAELEQLQAMKSTSEATPERN